MKWNHELSKDCIDKILGSGCESLARIGDCGGVTCVACGIESVFCIETVCGLNIDGTRDNSPGIIDFSIIPADSRMCVTW